MDLEDGLPAGQVRQLHRDAAVKAPRPEEGFVQGVRPVGGRQDDNSLFAVEAVHLGQQLVEGLLPLVVAADAAVVPLFADGVDLVDEHDAGGFFLGLFKQVPDFGCAHTHKHLHKFRAGDGKEGNLGFPSHRLGQQGLAGAGRAYQQGPFRHGGADGGVFGRVVEEVHNLL